MQGSERHGAVRWRGRFLDRWAGLFFLLLVGGFLLSLLAFQSPYAWPLLELGRQTAVLFGCTTLACAPLAWGLGLLYTSLFAVLLNALRTAVGPD